MSTPDLPVLDLRFRDAEWIDRPATLDEFARPAPTPDPHGVLAELLITDMLARSQTEIAQLLDGRVLFSVENARFGIPVGVRDLEAAPSLEDWHLREQLEVDLLDAGEDGRLVRSVAAQFRRGLIAVAGALPLLVSPMLAHAQAPLEQDVLTRVATGFGPPKLPEETQPKPAPAPAPTPETTAAPPVEPPPTAAPTVAPTAAPPPRIVGDGLTLTGTTVWEGLLGKRVKLAMKNEQVLDGTVVAQSTTDLAVARTSDGTVVAVPKDQISGVRLAGAAAAGGGSEMPVSQRPTEDGHGLNAGGAVMIGFGSVAALAGTVMLGIYPSGLYINLPLLLPGLAMIGGGSAMMAAASKKRKAFRQAWGAPATAKLKVMPTMSASRQGGQVGLVLRF